MKILLIGNDFHSIYYTRKELIKELVKDNVVFVAIPENERNHLIAKMGGVLVPFYINRMGKNPIKEVLTLLNIRRILAKVKPDIIYTFTIKPNVYTGLLQRKNANRQVVAITGLGRFFQKDNISQKLIILLYRLAFRNAKKVMFENHENQKIFEKYRIAKGKHLVVSGAGVNLAENAFEEYPDATGGIRFVFVGRIEPDKGIRELIEAARFFENSKKNIKFDVLGSCEESFQQEFSNIKIPTNMELLGWHMDTHAYVKRAHAIILPSYHEGMANVLLEAAATGRPILASEIPGCMESFDEGISGFGFPKKSPEGLIQAIEKFLSLSNKAKADMGSAARIKMEQEFNRDDVVRCYVEQMKK